MVGMSHSHTPSFDDFSGDRSTPIARLNRTATAQRIVALLGRALFGLVFVAAGPGHFSAATIEHARMHGVPMANVLVPLSGALSIAGGLSVMLGYRTKLGAAALIAFLVPVTLAMHAFWNVTDPGPHAMQHAMFMKNVALIGGAMLLTYFGAGPLSVDARIAVANAK